MHKEVIVVASSNKGKIKEIKEIFNTYEVLSIKDIEEKLNKKIIVNENQDTFKDNALEKVRDLYNQVGEDYIFIADDSGISIDALNGFPGVHTARWLDADDHTKNKELLKKLINVPKEKRTCHYTTVIALKNKNIEETFEYTLSGNISLEPRGTNGFGFDEIFELSNGKTLAEISTTEKLLISPRRKALDLVKEYITNIKLELVELGERNKLEKLLQLYLHDLSLYFPIPFNSNKCEYEYDLDKYFKDNYAYFIKRNNEILGFILIDNNKENNYEISEIFILNNYKRNHIGSKVVKQIFNIYRGNWIIKVVPNSKIAESFWINTIKEYTNNNYKEQYTGKYNRLEIYFNND